LQIWDAFLIAFSALLPLINPVGSALVFLGLVGNARPEIYRSLARRIAINNVIFLVIIELLGSAILRFFGISLPIVQLSGGIVIAAIGWSVLNQQDANETSQKERDCAELEDDLGTRALEQKAFYPFTFPVTSGPGTLVVMLTLAAHVSSPNLTRNILGHVGILIAVIVLSGLVYLCYAYAPKITTAISPATAHGILRVVAFILLCIGVQIAWNGLAQLLATVVKH
jgi:multiple antibiotic resistance protein